MSIMDGVMEFLGLHNHTFPCSIPELPSDRINNVIYLVKAKSTLEPSV